MLESAVAAAGLTDLFDDVLSADFGMRVVWCNRYAERSERLPGSPLHEIRTLAELPGLLVTSAH